jgi:hypothetical protein
MDHRAWRVRIRGLQEFLRGFDRPSAFSAGAGALSNTPEQLSATIAVRTLGGGASILLTARLVSQQIARDAFSLLISADPGIEPARIFRDQIVARLDRGSRSGERWPGLVRSISRRAAKSSNVKALRSIRTAMEFLFADEVGSRTPGHPGHT